ncbi:Ig-like domain-containing protein [Pseudomonas sp. B21-056]|uniref:Ig-like domain-containing protein n=1 Tax=Pseudomonas sp. B21-056 TaxID=2895495 RepID=UPI0022313DFF|nr:Ig-like domain-containing protein [Pseudomonas sp. B21-056]UZE25238.1 Ig-like domain-containing protein [Pseudomonas sp. B21-056]
MDIQSSTLDDLFELYPVIIPGWITPVKPAGLADGGIPKSLYDQEPQGLQCLIDPWSELKRQSWTMATDDRVDLYVNDNPTPVAGKTVAPGEETERIRLNIPHGQLTPGVNRLHYKVTRPGENAAPSRDLHVLYHLRAPGEPAPTGLDLVIPPDVVRDGVNAERAAQGVEFGFTYTNRRPYDRINFLVGEVTVPFEIVDASPPVVKTLFTDTFQQAGDNPDTVVEFTVSDQLGNFNRSPAKRLDVHLNQLVAPEITSVKDDQGNEIPNGTSTGATAVTLGGTGVSDQRVEIFDDMASKGIAYVDGGLWAHAVIGLAIGHHCFTAEGIHGVSQPWTFTVGPSDIIDTTPHVFTKVIYTTSNFQPKNRYYDLERKPAGGTPPYTYRSSKPSVATVDADEGGVLVKGAGTTTITVRDSAANTSSYDVTVHFVHDVIFNNGSAYMDAWQANAWATPYIQSGGFRPESGWGSALIARFEIGSEWLYPTAWIWAPPPLPPNGNWGFTSFPSDIVSFTDNATQFAGRALICLRVIG